MLHHVPSPAPPNASWLLSVPQLGVWQRRGRDIVKYLLYCMSKKSCPFYILLLALWNGELLCVESCTYEFNASQRKTMKHLSCKSFWVTTSLTHSTYCCLNLVLFEMWTETLPCMTGIGEGRPAPDPKGWQKPFFNPTHPVLLGCLKTFLIYYYVFKDS